MARKTYVLRDGKLVEKHLAPPLRDDRKVLILPDIEPFVSPVTGEVITSRNKLRRHMREHDITRREDYSPGWYERKAQERASALACDTPRDRQDRIEALKHALEKHHARK